MSYWQLRFAIYSNAIKSMRETLKQLGMAVVVFFQVALPAVFLFFLVGLGQLAEPNNSLSIYVSWLVGYGILMYGLIRAQRHAILGSAVNYWDAGLPISNRRRRLVTAGICAIAGNIFLIVPMVFLSYLFLSHFPESLSLEGVKQLWPLLMVCLWGVQVSIMALYRRYFPVLSLIVGPFLLILLLSEDMNASWLLMFFVMPTIALFIDEQRLSITFNIRFIWQLFAWYQLSNWQGLLLRLIALVLCGLFFSNLLDGASLSAKSWVLLFCIFVSATLASTLQFSLLDFRDRYRYFLLSLPVDVTVVTIQLLFLVLFIGGVFAFITAMLIGFYWQFYLIWAILYCVGLWSVNRFKQRFFIPLIALFGLFGTMVNFMPSAFI